MSKWQIFEHPNNPDYPSQWQNVEYDPLDRICQLELKLAEVRMENERLCAELEKRKLKWQTGPIPKVGFYLTRRSPIGETRYECLNTRAIAWQWAGPIEPPEEK